MTKSNSFKIIKKLPLWLAIPAVIILAGAVLFFLLGFNPSASVADSKSLTVSHDLYINTSETLSKELRALCETEIKESGLHFINCEVAETADGGQIEYTFSAATSDGDLYRLWENIQAEIENSDTLRVSVYTAAVHDNVTQYFYGYIWRAAICVGVALILAFIYVAIRYRLSMGLAAFIAGVLDVAVMLSFIVILRIPVTTALATAAIFAAIYSILVSTVSLNKIRSLLKSEEYKSMPVADAVEQANQQALKRVLILSAAVFVFCLLLTIFGGAAVRAFALPAICSVAASTFSGILLTPSLIAAFKLQGVEMKQKKEEKDRLARKKEEEERAKKRNAKKD